MYHGTAGVKIDKCICLISRIAVAGPYGERAYKLRANVKPERWQYPPQPDDFKEALREAITQRATTSPSRKDRHPRPRNSRGAKSSADTSTESAAQHNGKHHGEQGQTRGGSKRTLAWQGGGASVGSPSEAAGTGAEKAKRALGRAGWTLPAYARQMA